MSEIKVELLNGSLTESYVDLLFGLTQVDFSEEVYIQAKKCLLDYLGVTFAGSVMLKEKTSLFLELNTNPDGVKPIGIDHYTSLTDAAFINGLNAHVAELDDGERFGMFHPGAVLFSALMPLARKFSISDSLFLKAVIVGYEAAIRLARSLQPMLKDKGFHGTGVCGVAGAAIAAGMALNFSKQQLKDALSAALTSSSGLLKVIKDRSEMKPFNVGIAAKNGLNAALFVKSGFNGPDDVLDGELGFLNAFTGSFDIDKLLATLDTPAIMQIYMKPYAACRHCHPAIEAALIIKDKYDVQPDSIRSINVETYYWAVGGHDHTDIVGVNSAKMSTPFSIAVALQKGKAGINEFTQDNINNELIQQLTNKVIVKVNDEFTALVPEKRGAQVSIETNDNLVHTERIDYPKGEPETALTMDDVQSKFIALAEYAGLDKWYYLTVLDCVVNEDKKIADLLSII